jgi:hypothetical protein
MLNRYGPMLDLREASEDDLRRARQAFDEMASDQRFKRHYPGLATIYRQLTKGVEDELIFRALQSPRELVVPDFLDI